MGIVVPRGLQAGAQPGPGDRSGVQACSWPLDDLAMQCSGCLSQWHTCTLWLCSTQAYRHGSTTQANKGRLRHLYLLIFCLLLAILTPQLVQPRDDLLAVILQKQLPIAGCRQQQRQILCGASHRSVIP